MRCRKCNILIAEDHYAYVLDDSIVCAGCIHKTPNLKETLLFNRLNEILSILKKMEAKK